jgi:amino acid transporter
LTILGVVMFLRLGWVLGNVGLLLTIVIVTISCAITFLTGLAIAALATNMKIGAGGAYYIISRSLGLEVGAAVGLPLYLAQALGISFYIAGFSEAVVDVWPDLDPTVVGVVTLVVLSVLAFLSANLALRMQFFILTAIVLSLVSFFLGGRPESTADSIAPAEMTFASFWIVFAVFFPAVTGIEAGISLSGDLKDPGKSLARGTIAAVLVGYLVYLLIPIFLAGVVDNRHQLIENRLIMCDVARWGNVIHLGLWGASISSAIGAILGAPRTLQSLASDRILPQFLGRTCGKGNDPRIATALSFCIAFTGILLGDLNLIAPVLSMFFLTSYGLLNTSASLEAAIAAPSWRPRLKLNWKLHLMGALACYAAMLMISVVATFVALAVAVGLFVLMKRRCLRARWGDVRYGLSMMMVQSGLRRLAHGKPDVHTWKPNILVLSGAPTRRWYLIELANAISQGKSLMTVAAILAGDNISDERAQTLRQTINDYLQREKIESLVTVLRADTMAEGLQSLVSAYGFGPLVPNTILLGETERLANLDDHVRLIYRICHLKRNLVIIREKQQRASYGVKVDRNGEHVDSTCAGASDDARIDIWWRGKGHNAGLMLALAFQLRQDERWKHHSLVLKTIVSRRNHDNTAAHGRPRDKAKQQLDAFLERERIVAETEVIELCEKESPFELIGRSSRDASLMLVGIRPPDADESLEAYRGYYQMMLRETSGFPMTALVFAAEDLPFKQIFST